MTVRFDRLALVTVLAVAPYTASAQGFLGGQGGLDPKFCDQPAVRQTVVYIDDLIMQDGQSEWAAKIYDKLKATLVPGEHVAVVDLSPTDGQSHETWTGCWPDYGAKEREQLSKQYSFFSKSPLKAIDNQQGYFASGFAGALSDIYDKHHRLHTTIDAANPPAKAILGALSSDGARYAQTKVTIRAIIYSDFAENSELGSVFKPLPQPPTNYGKKLGTYLRSSVFYGFGVDEDVHGGEDVREATRAFWTSALGSMSATIGGFGSDLNVPNALPVDAHSYSVDLDESGQPLSGRLSLLVDADGNLVDSWLGISRLSSAAVTGTMQCEPAGTCTINGVTSHGILSDSPSENFTLSGDGSSPLIGQIGVKGSNVMFPLKATVTPTR